MQSMQDRDTSAAAIVMEFDENKPSYDILEWFPILYCQDVFKYLDGEDLLEASTVNKEWYKLVAESSQMKKLKLITSTDGECGWPDEVKDILMNSKRKYENFELDSISYQLLECYLKFLESRTGSWKSVTIYVGCEKDIDALSEIFKIIEPTVEELSIYTSTYTEHAVKVNTKMIFPRLKSLTCEAYELSVYGNFVRCRNLIKFYWEEDYVSEGMRSHFTPDVLTILRNNHGLKDIDVNNEVMSEANSFRFKLQKLKVNGRAGVPENLFSFLKVHAQNLESLEILVELNRDCLELILTGLPKLRKLTMNEFKNDKVTLADKPLPMNTTIVTFELTDAMWGSRKAYGILIKALQNLKHFKSVLIDCKLLVTIARNAPALEFFETKFFDLAYLPEEEMFPNIKEFKAKKFNEWMREPTAENKFAALVAEEMGNHPEIEFCSGSGFTNARDGDSEDGSTYGNVQSDSEEGENFGYGH